MHQCHELVVLLEYDALVHHRHGVELVFYLLWIDVLSVRAQQHVLASSSYEEVAFRVHRCQVACVEPSVFIDYGIRSLLVLVVALHHVDATANQFAGHVFRVIAQNLHLHVLHGSAAASCHIVVLMGEGDEWSGFGGSVAHGDRKAHADEEVLNLLVEWCATHNHLVRAIAKLAEHELANLLLDALVDDRHVHQEAGTVGLYMWEHFLSYNLIHHERHGEEDVWLNLSQCLRDERWARQAGEEEDVVTHHDVEEELSHQSVHVCHRQGREDVAVLSYLRSHGIDEIVEIAPECPVRQHHTLREPCGSAGVVDHRQFFRIIHVILYVLCPEILRIFVAEHGVEVLARVGQFF